eukprot:scaffold11574_cov124-Isochrysis_galbana.AAC.6
MHKAGGRNYYSLKSTRTVRMALSRRTALLHAAGGCPCRPGQGVAWHVPGLPLGRRRRLLGLRPTRVPLVLLVLLQPAHPVRDAHAVRLSHAPAPGLYAPVCGQGHGREVAGRQAARSRHPSPEAEESNACH